MGQYFHHLCSTILLEHFGSYVQSVGDVLFEKGPLPLSSITKDAKLPTSKIKECLCVLITFNFVENEENDRVIRYQLYPERVLLILRYSRFMLFVKNCSGDDCEIMFEEFLKKGYETASQVIVKTYNRRQQTDSSYPDSSNDPALVRPCVESLVEKFETLLKNQFLIRYTSRQPSTGDSETTNANVNDNSMPQLDISALIRIIQGDNADPGDNRIYWRVNFDRLIQDLRDELIVSTMSRMVDENAGQLMRQIIFLMYGRTALWADSSNPIPYIEIKARVKDLNIPHLTQYLDQYLRLIEDEPKQFLKRVGDSGGGQYSVDVKEVITELTWATVENIIMERLGSKVARIFRLVRSRKYIEQEHIHQLAMIQAKEAKQLTYVLQQERYLLSQEVKKIGRSSIQQSRGMYLFHVNLNRIVRMEIERCHHALYNIMLRRRHEVSSNKRVMEKSIRMQVILSHLKASNAPETQLADIEGMLTEPERIQLNTVEKAIKTMGSVELRIEETLFLLKLYLSYHYHEAYLGDLYVKK